MTPEIALMIREFFELLFPILVVVFIIHTIILSYHWYTYGDQKSISTTALIVYVAGGVILFLTLGAITTLL